MPLRLEPATLSRMRSPITSRSNWAKESNTLSVSRPIEVVVLNCWVTATKDTLCASNSSTSRLLAWIHGLNDRGDWKANGAAEAHPTSAKGTPRSDWLPAANRAMCVSVEG